MMTFVWVWFGCAPVAAVLVGANAALRREDLPAKDILGATVAIVLVPPLALIAMLICVSEAVASRWPR